MTTYIPPSQYTPHDRNRVLVHVGDRVRVELPYSEVCMSMRVAGTVMDVEIVGREFDDYVSVTAQLWTLDAKRFSAPILLGEAGIFGTMAEGMYAYGTLRASTCGRCRQAITLADDGAWNGPAGECGCGDDEHHPSAASCAFDAADECAMARERSVAGKSEDIPACPVHGAHPFMTALRRQS